MSMGKIVEKPFEYLTRKENGKKFEDEIVRNWYIARSFVLSKFKEEKVGFTPDSNDHLHVVVVCDSPMMLSVVRQVALTAHFVNFREGCETEAPRNRTVITLVSKNPNVKTKLEKEEYLCNLPKYCKMINNGITTENEGFFIDIEIHIVDDYSVDSKEDGTICFSESDVDVFCKKATEEVYGIDTRMSIYTSRIYDLGVEFHNIPAEDIHSARRYSLALNIFQHEMLKKNARNMITEKWETMSLCKIKEQISNILCSDCFALRNECIRLCKEDKSLSNNVLWEKYNELLSVSEHARWIVEKLIMGYRPFNEIERYHDETLHAQFKNKDKRKKYRDGLKRNDQDPAHIDLCPYRDLRRINPDDMKYDSFLMLAIPKILERMKADAR